MIEALCVITILFFIIAVFIIAIFDLEDMIYGHEDKLKIVMVICLCMFILITISRPFLFQKKEFEETEIKTYTKFYVNNWPFELPDHIIKIKVNKYRAVKPFNGAVYWINNPSDWEEELIGIYKTNPTKVVEE